MKKVAGISIVFLMGLLMTINLSWAEDGEGPPTDGPPREFRDGDRPGPPRRGRGPQSEEGRAARRRVQELRRELHEAKESGDDERVKEIHGELREIHERGKKKRGESADGERRGKGPQGKRKGPPKNRPDLSELPEETRNQLKALRKRMRAARESGDTDKMQELRKQMHKILKEAGVEPRGPRDRDARGGEGRRGPPNRRGPPPRRGGGEEGERGGRDQQDEVKQLRDEVRRLREELQRRDSQGDEV